MLMKNFAFALTDKCSAACDICCFSCSPAKNNVLDKEVIKNYIDQVAELNSDHDKSISFTVGEALLFYDMVLDCVSYAKKRGLNTGIVSNGFWGKNLNDASNILKELHSAGLSSLALSVDIHHQRYVPIEYIKNILKVIRNLNIKFEIRMLVLKGDDSFKKSISGLRPDIYGFNIHVTPFFPVGNAAKMFPADKFIKKYKSETATCPFEGSLVAMFNGNMLMCCSQFTYKIPMLKIGTFGKTSVKEAIDNISNNDFIYVMFRNGLGWYAKLAKKLNFHVEDYYCAACHLCYELFSNEEFIKQAEPYVEEKANRLRLQKLFSA